MTYEELKKKKICAISLGCDKNRVDLERMLFSIKDYGCEVVSFGEEADVVIINTCAFILPARQEALTNIFECIDLKKAKKIEKIIVTGCLPEKHLSELQDTLPEVDAFVLLRDNKNIVNVIERTYGLIESKLSYKSDRLLTNNSSYAYLKIADGCNNACAYCTIPRIRGRYRSYPKEELIKEAKTLAKRGVKELILVAQDVTRYGEDLYNENKLIELIGALSKINEIAWIRILYCYPEKVTKELLDCIKNNPKVCKYIDIPLQHIDDNILREMNRRLNEDDTRQLIKRIKNEYSEIAIRSTFIIGFPKETRAAFHNLCSFLIDTRFDLAGFFPYSREEATRAFYMRNQVLNITKKRRVKYIKNLQYNIMHEDALKRIGQKYKALIDAYDSSTGEFIGHTEFLTPEVDFELRIMDNSNINIGSFVEVEITSFENSVYKGEVI